jgi:hypothetical protein
MTQPSDTRLALANSLACRFTSAQVAGDGMTMLLTFGRVEMEKLWHPFAVALASLVTNDVVEHDLIDPQSTIESLQAHALTWEREGGETRW